MANITITKNGKKCVKVYAGVNPKTGRKREVSETLPANASDADIAASINRLEAKAAVTLNNPELMTIETVLTDYLDMCELDGMSQTTLATYQSYCKKHIFPEIGSVSLDKANAAVFSSFEYSLRRDKKLSQATVRQIHSFISGCFSTLNRNGMISDHPLKGMKVARGKQKEVHSLGPAEVDKIESICLAMVLGGGRVLDNIRSEGYKAEAFDNWMLSAVWYVALHTGCRRGELCGLRRRDVRRSAGYPEIRISTVLTQPGYGSIVRKPPKSSNGCRPISLDNKTYEVICAVMAMHEELDNAGVLGVDVNEYLPLFCHRNGEPFSPMQLDCAFKDTVKAYGLPKGTHLHTLRHTHATMLIESGVDVKTVQERLGHYSATLTLDTYAHVMPGRDKSAADAFANAVSNNNSVANRWRIEPNEEGSVICPMTREKCECLSL